MVFEHLAAFFIDKFLGNYIEDFDSHQLKLNLWHGLFSLERYSFPMNDYLLLGNITLENVYLKSNALVND